MTNTLAPWMDFAEAELGVKEIPGSGNNQRVVDYIMAAVGKNLPDSTPWCAGFIGAMLTRADYWDSDSLMARSYSTFGEKVAQPDIRIGDIVVFPRPPHPDSGHVTFFAGWEDAGRQIFFGLGGNQSNAVTKARYNINEAIAIRRPTLEENKAAVKKMQRSLLTLGYDLGKNPIDGVIGTKTRAAYAKWAQSHGCSDTKITAARLDTLDREANHQDNATAAPAGGVVAVGVGAGAAVAASTGSLWGLVVLAAVGVALGVGGWYLWRNRKRVLR